MKKANLLVAVPVAANVASCLANSLACSGSSNVARRLIFSGEARQMFRGQLGGI